MSNADFNIYCSNCKKNVAWHVEPFNHREQLRLTLLTLGFWLPMWLIFAFVRVKRCDICKSPLIE